MGFWLCRTVVSGASALVVIAIGFMLENLFLDEWSWEAWGIVAILALVVSMLAGWIESRLVIRAKTKNKHMSGSTADYLEVCSIVNSYIDPDQSMRDIIRLTVRNDIIKRFEKVTGSKLGKYKYNRALLHQWMQSNAARILVNHRGEML